MQPQTQVTNQPDDCIIGELSPPIPRLQEAQTFLRAFEDRQAREFVRTFMCRNYSEAVLLHHPHPSDLKARSITEQCNKLVNTVFGEIELQTATPQNLFPLLARYSRANLDRSDIWFSDFIAAYQNYKHHTKLAVKYSQLAPYLQGKSYCDVGCGGGDLVYYLKQHHPSFNITAGIDILDWRTPAIKDQIGFHKLDFSRSGTQSPEQYDTVTCLAVLHHVGDTKEELSIFLKGMLTAVRKGGVIIVEEDVIVTDAEGAVNGVTEQLNYLKTIQPNYAQFVKFPEEIQRNIIIIVDVISNTLAVGVPEMPFPCGFHNLSEWCSHFRDNHLTVEDIILRGFVRGNFNQSSHVHFILRA